MNPAELFRWTARVYYEDTDAGGVVYHARYIAFYERARTEMLRQSGFSQNALLAENVAFVVRKMSVDYYYPAHLDEQLEIVTRITGMGKASIKFKQEIFNSQYVCLSSADVLIACVSLSLKKPIALPKSIVAEFCSG